MAFAEPYTYTDLQKDLTALEKLASARHILTRESLCSTLAGYPCDLLTITSSKSSSQGKKAVVLTGRVHPGETVGSWMMKGVLEFLLGGSADAERLLELYVFKVIPMLNSEGVIQGNYRCSLSGCDLNRRYDCPSKVRILF